MSDKELYSGMIRLHILYHASKDPIFGLGIIEELGRHGYKLSPGTLYPILHGLERKGYLRSTEKRDGRQARRLYRATPAGRKALKAAKEKVRELVGELFDEE
jgi:PadR family transcriptional regulator PadR